MSKPSLLQVQLLDSSVFTDAKHRALYSALKILSSNCWLYATCGFCFLTAIHTHSIRRTKLVHMLHWNYTFSEVIQYVNTAPRVLCPLIGGMIDRKSSLWLLALGKHLNHRNRFCLIFCVINVRERVLRLASTSTGSAQLWATNLSDDFIYRSRDHRADGRRSRRGLCLSRTEIEPTSDSPTLSHCQIGPYRDSPRNTSSRTMSCDGQAGSLIQMSTLHVLMNYDWIVEQPITTTGS